MNDLQARIEFLVEADKLKQVLRQSLVFTGHRRENTGEHSWHLVLAVLTLAPHADEPFDLLTGLKMAMLHDLVEIDAGDTFVYDETHALTKDARERAAAERIFGLLPTAQGTEFRQLWERFERRECAESRFVAALDRFLPILANSRTEGHSWKSHGIRKEQALKRNAGIDRGSKAIWVEAQRLIDQGAERGWLKND